MKNCQNIYTRNYSSVRFLRDKDCNKNGAMTEELEWEDWEDELTHETQDNVSDSEQRLANLCEYAQTLLDSTDSDSSSSSASITTPSPVDKTFDIDPETEKFLDELWGSFFNKRVNQHESKKRNVNEEVCLDFFSLEKAIKQGNIKGCSHCYNVALFMKTDRCSKSLIEDENITEQFFTDRSYFTFKNLESLVRKQSTYRLSLGHKYVDPTFISFCPPLYKSVSSETVFPDHVFESINKNSLTTGALKFGTKKYKVEPSENVGNILPYLIGILPMNIKDVIDSERRTTPVVHHYFNGRAFKKVQIVGVVTERRFGLNKDYILRVHDSTGEILCVYKPEDYEPLKAMSEKIAILKRRINNVNQRDDFTKAAQMILRKLEGKVVAHGSNFKFTRGHKVVILGIVSEFFEEKVIYIHSIKRLEYETEKIQEIMKEKFDQFCRDSCVSYSTSKKYKYRYMVYAEDFVDSYDSDEDIDPYKAIYMNQKTVENMVVDHMDVDTSTESVETDIKHDTVETVTAIDKEEISEISHGTVEMDRIMETTQVEHKILET